MNITRKKNLIAAIIAVLTLFLILLVYVKSIGTEQLYITGVGNIFNDQSNYLSAARNLNAGNALASDIIYPSTLLQTYGRNYLYMPGHAVLLAQSLKLFGESVWSIYLPNLISYFICMVGLFILGWKLHSVPAGVISALLFSILPTSVLYSFSAMSEMTFLAAGVIAFTGFVLIPFRWRSFISPILLLMPFLFRETGAILVIPMLVVTIFQINTSRAERWRAATIIIVGSVCLLSVVFRLDYISDRPSLLLQNILGLGDYDKYFNAYSTSNVNYDLGMFISVVFSTAMQNLRTWGAYLTYPSYELVNLYILLVIPAYLSYKGWKITRIRPLILAWGLHATVIVIIITFVYRVGPGIAIRQLLLPGIFAILFLSILITETVVENKIKRLALPVGMGIIFCMTMLLSTVKAVEGSARYQEVITEVLKLIPDPEDGIIVTEYCPIYVYQFPLRTCSFLPDPKTFRLLTTKYNVQVVLMPKNLEHQYSRILDDSGLKYTLDIIDKGEKDLVLYSKKY